MRHNVLIVLSLAGWAAAGCGDSSLPVGQDAAINDGAADSPVDGVLPMADAPAAEAPRPRDGATPAADAGAPSSDAGALPAACQVKTDRAPPYNVQFRFTNRGSRPVYLHQGCIGIAYWVSSCASRYTDSVGPTFVCACDCSDPSCRGDVACGPCPPPVAVTVAPGQTHEVAWAAIAVKPMARTGYTCADRRPLPASRYSLAIDVFATAEAAIANAAPAARVVSRVFELPAAGDTVELDLALPASGDAGPPAMPACEAAATAAPCAPPWDPAVACALGSTYAIQAEGGLRASLDTMTLSPPATFSRNRSYADPMRPPASCTNQIPRCGATHELFTTADVMEAMAAPDVVAAFAQPQPLVYGYDSRPHDGSVLAIRRADGRGLFVGSECTVTQPCQRPATEGIRRLTAVLLRLEAQQVARPECAALR